MKNLLPTIFVALAILGCSCDTTEPINTEDIYEPGKRDYSWTIDTLNNDAPFNHYSKIWGSSHNDVWIVGGAGDFDKTIIRYNGNSWKYYGKNISLDPSSCYGFSSNNIWFGGANYDIWHSNGFDVTKHTELKLTNFRGSFISDIWGDAENDVYAVGSLSHNDGSLHAMIMHYNGNKWQYVINPIPELQFLQIRKNYRDNNYYLLGYKTHNNAPDTSNFYSFNRNEIKPLDIDQSEETLGKNIVLMDDKLYFMHNFVIYKYMNGTFSEYINLVGSAADNIKFWGRHEKDFFIQTSNGLGHYNGNSVKELYKLNENFGIIEGLIFENDVLFIGFYKNSFKFFLIHGKIEK